MLKKYPKFLRGQLQEIYESFSSDEKKVIENYLNYRKIESKSESKIKDYRRYITQFKHIIEKNFDNITYQDIIEFLSLLNQTERTLAGKDDLKSCIKNFLKWKYGDWSKRFKDLKIIKTHSTLKKKNHKKINSETMLSKEEVEKLIKGEESNYWKTFFITLFESALRPIELRTLKWKDVNFNVKGDISELNVFSSKTSTFRKSYVKDSTFYLKKLKNNSESEYIFPSPNDNNKPISKSASEMRLNRLSIKVFGKKVNPYILRHSRATQLYKLSNENKISKDAVIKFMGHSKDMSELYTNLDGETIKNIITQQVYNFEDIPEERKHELEEKIENLEKEIEMIKEYIVKSAIGNTKTTDKEKSELRTKIFGIISDGR